MKTELRSGKTKTFKKVDQSLHKNFYVCELHFTKALNIETSTKKISQSAF